MIFKRLDNMFVQALLQAYWSAYEAVGLDLYADYSYLHEVWTYHERIVDAIEADDAAAGHRALLEHFELLQSRPQLAGIPAESLDGRGAPERAQEVD